MTCGGTDRCRTSHLHSGDIKPSEPAEGSERKERKMYSAYPELSPDTLGEFHQAERKSRGFQTWGGHVHGHTVCLGNPMVPVVGPH